MDLTLYFAYGSNLDSEQMRERCPTSEPLFRARLVRHRLGFTHFSTRWRGGAADVIPDQEREVWGVVYRLQAADLILLDRFESGYERRSLAVADDAEQTHTVISYSVLDKREFAPSDVYLDKMLHWGRHWCLPSDYLTALERYRSR